MMGLSHTAQAYRSSSEDTRIGIHKRNMPRPFVLIEIFSLSLQSIDHINWKNGLSLGTLAVVVTVSCKLVYKASKNGSDF